MSKLKTIRKKYSSLKFGDMYIHEDIVKTVGKEISKPRYVCEVVIYIVAEFPKIMRIPINGSAGFLIKPIVHYDKKDGYLSTEGQFYPEAFEFNDDVVKLSFEKRHLFAGKKIRKKGAIEEFSILGCNLDHIYLVTGKVSFEDAFNDYEFVNGEIFGELKQ